jgi:hypothetical protein
VEGNEPQLNTEDPAEEPESGHGDGWYWSSLRFPGEAVAVLPRNQGGLLAMDASGQVFALQRQGGWSLSLGRAWESEEIDDESLLLDAESALQELLDFDDLDEEQSFSVDALEEDDDQTSDLATQNIDDELESSIFDPLRESQRDRLGALLWMDPLTKHYFACHNNGCFRSTDGRSWTYVDDLASANALERFGPIIVAASSDGIWISTTDGRTWRRPPYASASIDCLDLASALFTQQDESNPTPDILMAACDDGFYYSLDGLQWTQPLKNVQRGGFSGIQPNPQLAGSLWVSTENGLMRSDDLGLSFQALGADHLVGPHTLLRLPQGTLVAAGGQGIWESEDSGLRWTALKDGLNTSQVDDLVSWKGSLVIATREGVHHLLKEQEAAVAVGQKTFSMPPLDLVLQQSLVELDTQINGLEMQRRMLRRARFPTLGIDGAVDRNHSISSDYGAISSKANGSRNWSIGADMCFGNCGSMSSSGSMAGYADQLMVMDGQVYSSNDSGIVPAATGISNTLMQYRNDRASYVIDLYTAYTRLLDQNTTLSGLSLVEQSLHELERREVYARLMAVTDGKFKHILREGE